MTAAPRARRHRRPLLPLATLGVVLALVLSGCGGDGDAGGKPGASASATPTDQLPTGSADVPDGVTLTRAGATLAFGEDATVAYQPNTQRSSVITLAVDSVQTGTMKDFAAYQLDEQTKKSTPYYVKVSAANVGTGDLSRAAVPLYAVDARNTLIQPSTFNNTFQRCPSTPLPAAFGAGKTYTGCLVYLVPAGGTLTQMSYRPLQAFEPIVWKGTIAPVAATTKKKKKADS